MQAPTHEIVLREWETRAFERSRLPESIAIELAESKYVGVDFPTPLNNRKYLITPRNHIGAIPIRDVVVRIEPKVPVASVFGMLELAYGLKSFRLHPGLIDLESIPELYERLARILANGVIQRVRRGLYQEYEKYSEDAALIRGRVAIGESIKLWSRASPSVHCEYHVNTTDNPDNQILAWTLDKIQRYGLVHSTTQNVVAKAQRTLQGSVSLEPACIALLGNRNYTKLNADYEPLHAICRFLIENSGPALSSGSRVFIPFTIDMANLFEVFVARWLEAALPSHLVLKKQERHYLGEGDAIYFQIDLVVFNRASGHAVCVLDTKYKNDTQPSSTDIEQAVAYAVQVDTAIACLVYPTADVDTKPRPVGPNSAVVIHPLVFDLSQCINESGALFLASLLDILNEQSNASG